MVFGLFDNSPQRTASSELDELEDELPDLDSIGLEDDDLDELDDDEDADPIDVDFEEI